MNMTVIIISFHKFIIDVHSLLVVTVVESAVSSAFGVFKEVINTATFGGFDAAVNATVSIVNSPFNVIKEAVKGIPDLV